MNLWTGGVIGLLGCLFGVGVIVFRRWHSELSDAEQDVLRTLQTKASLWDDHIAQLIAGREEKRDAVRLAAISAYHGKRGTGLIEATAVLVHVFGLTPERAAIVACDWVRVVGGGQVGGTEVRK